MHGLRGDEGVVAPLRAIFPDAEPLHEALRVRPANAGVASAGQPQGVGGAAEALIDLPDHILCGRGLGHL